MYIVTFAISIYTYKFSAFMAYKVSMYIFLGKKTNTIFEI